MVNVEREGNILEDAILLPFTRSCPVHTVDHFDSKRWFSCHLVIFSMCFVRSLAKQQAAFVNRRKFLVFSFRR